MSSTSVLSRDSETQTDFTVFWGNLGPLFGLPYPPNDPSTDYTPSHNEGFIQEFRLTSPTDQRLRWVAGAYFSRFRQHSAESTNSQAFADALGQTESPNLYSFDQVVIDQQAAVFADLTYKVAPRFEVTVGARYYEIRYNLVNTPSADLAAPSQPLVHANASGTSPRFVPPYPPALHPTPLLP